MFAQWPSHFSTDIVRDAFGTRLGGFTIALEAWRRGLQVRLYDSQLRRFQISDGRRSIRFDKSRPSLTTKHAVSIEQDKYRTASYLREAGVAVPDHVTIDVSADNAEVHLLRSAENLGYPVVLKPVSGSMGRDVYSNIPDAKELLDTLHAIRSGARVHRYFILEQHFKGEEYRVLVVGERVSGVFLKLPANIVGDGVLAVRELIEAKNADRRNNPSLCQKPIVVDREVKAHLSRQGLSESDIVPKNITIPLRDKASASQGGDTVDMTDEIPEELKVAAIKATAALPGLALAGVDILFNSASTPSEDSYRVLELNSRPEIELNMYPSEGIGQDVPEDIIDVLFPASSRSQDENVTDIGLNLPQLLEPLRGASADEVLLKAKPSHNYPVRLAFHSTRAVPLTGQEANAVHLAARRASVSGFCGGPVSGAQVVVCGTQEQVNKFLRLAEPALMLDESSAGTWDGIVRRGFQVLP